MQPFEYIEPLTANQFDANTSVLTISSSSSSKIKLLRGIIGSVVIKHTLSQTEFKQTIDYLDLGNENKDINPILRLKDYISSDLTIDEFSKYFSDKKFLYQNNSYFDKLNNEFANFFYYENKCSHTTAFIYIYRILETISYAFPLIYASKSDDFKGTYRFLKECLSVNPDRDKGELGFFKSFIQVAFNKDPIFESSITIEVKANTSDIQQLFFNCFKKACPESVFDSTDTDEPRQIAIKFSEYSSFIINLRNRFFHLFSSGQPNLQSDEIVDADYFFGLMNKPSVNWLSIVLIKVLNFSIERTTV